MFAHKFVRTIHFSPTFWSGWTGPGSIMFRSHPGIVTQIPLLFQIHTSFRGSWTSKDNMIIHLIYIYIYIMMLLLVSYNLRALEGTESARSKRSSRKPPAGGDGVPHAMTHGLVALCFRMKPGWNLSMFIQYSRWCSHSHENILTSAIFQPSMCLTIWCHHCS